MTNFNAADFAAAAAADAAKHGPDYNKRAETIVGYRNKGLVVSEVAGVVGGILGGVCALSAGHSKGAAIGGAIAGAVGGYAIGNIIGPIADLSTGTKVLGGIFAGSFGISCATLGASIVDSLCALGDQ